MPAAIHALEYADPGCDGHTPGVGRTHHHRMEVDGILENIDPVDRRLPGRTFVRAAEEAADLDAGVDLARR